MNLIFLRGCEPISPECRRVTDEPLVTKLVELTSDINEQCGVTDIICFENPGTVSNEARRLVGVLSIARVVAVELLSILVNVALQDAVHRYIELNDELTAQLMMETREDE